MSNKSAGLAVVGRDPNGLDAHAPGAKLDAGKAPMSLVVQGMPRALEAVAQVAAYGAQKYSPNGWQHVENGALRYTDALLRHLAAEGIGPMDAESGLRHAAQVAWNALARLELILRDEACVLESIERFANRRAGNE